MRELLAHGNQILNAKLMAAAEAMHQVTVITTTDESVGTGSGAAPQALHQETD